MKFVKNSIIVAAIIITCGTATFANGQCKDTTLLKSTVLYAIKGDDTLYLDKYECRGYGSQAPKPAVIYMFGGGFYTGIRSNKSYYPYFKFLAEKGYTVFSIDYRLGLKKYYAQKKQEGTQGAGKSRRRNMLEFVGTLNKSIDMAVEDLYSATSFILKHSKDWNIDSSSIIASGSSAGAISVLHAEFYLANRMKYSNTEMLPHNFNYAGIISFAGAILNYRDKLHWDTAPSPIALFHGDADPTVPFNRIWTPWGSFNGSKKIAGTLNKMNVPNMFCIYKNMDHKIANLPLTTGLNYIASFLDNIIVGKKKMTINITVSDEDNAVKSKSDEKREQTKEISKYMSGNHNR